MFVSPLSKSSSIKTILYTAWFCPYAQRAEIALSLASITYQRVESLSFAPGSNYNQYVKIDELLEANPKGLVPVIVQSHPEGHKNSPKTIVCDSIDCLKAIYANPIHDEPLYQDIVHWNKNLCSKLYSILLAQDPVKSEAEFHAMCCELDRFASHLSISEDGIVSFYNNGKDPGIVDVAVYPFIFRLFVIHHYKGFTYQGPGAKTVQQWQRRMEDLPAVRKTLDNIPRDELIRVYAPYAEGTAKSSVADSVRRGNHAHDV